MGELKGFLYICKWTFLSDVSVWVMNEYGIEESWTKVYNIDTSFNPSGCLVLKRSGLWPIKHFEEGVAILLYHFHNCFIFHEPEKYGFKVFRIHGSYSDIFEVIPHIPSLIPSLERRQYRGVEYPLKVRMQLLILFLLAIESDG